MEPKRVKRIARLIAAAGVAAGIAAIASPATAALPAPVTVSPATAVNNVASQTLSVTGTEFTGVTSAKLIDAADNDAQPDIQGSNLTVSSNTSLSATFDLTAAAPGSYNLVLTKGGSTPPETGTCASCFTLTNNGGAPTFTSVSPSSRGQGATNQNITLTGTGFARGVTANFGAGITVNSTTFVSTTQATANITISSTATTGARTLTVSNTDALAGTCPTCFTVLVGPTLAATDPVLPASRGKGAQNQNLTVTGTGFNASVGVSFSDSGITVNSVTRDSSQQLTVNVSVSSLATEGPNSITVTNPDAGAATCSPTCFTINAAPNIDTITPSSRGQGATSQTLTIVGDNFSAPPAVVPGVTFSGTGITVNSVTRPDPVNPNELSVNVTVASNAATGSRDVTLTNADAGVYVCPNCFTVSAGPSVSSVSPTSRGQGASNQVLTVTGTNFQSGIGLTDVSFSGDGISIDSVVRNSSTQLTVTIDIDSGATASTRSITVRNPDFGLGSCSSCLTINAAPTVTSLNPNNRGQGASSQTITVNGTNFLTTPTVSFTGSGITVNSVTRTSATQLSLNVTVASNAATGTRDVSVTNPDGGPAVSCTSCFTVNAAPTATAVSPASVANSAAETLTITGTNFADSGTAILRRGTTDITGTGWTKLNATTIRATFNLANVSPGTWSIRTTNSDQGGPGVCTDCLTITATAPDLTSASPSSRGQGASNQTITLNGASFAHGLGVTFSNPSITVNSVSWVSATQVTANISVAQDAPTGASNITITNTDNQADTCTGCFTVTAAPTVTLTSPSSRGANSSNQNVTITGTEFTGTPSVAFSGGGITVNSVTRDSAVQLTANISVASGAATTARTLTVTNPDQGVGTCGDCFTVNAAPGATSVTPSARGQGATSQSVVIAGSGFVGTPAVSFGSGVTVNSVTLDSAEQLTANLTVASGAATGVRSVTVTNPDAGVATCADCFTVNAAPTASSASPSSRGQGAANQNVVLTGTAFVGTPTVAFSGSGVTVNSVIRDDATQLTVNVTIAPDAAAGARTITVTNPDAGLATCACFTVNAAAAIASVSPSALGQNAPATDLVVTGTGFAASPTVTFSGSGVTVNSVTRDSATQLTVNVSVASGATTGARTLTVTNTDQGVGTCGTCFSVNAGPGVTSASPASRGQGAANQDVVLTGTAFVATPTVAFSGSGVTVNSVTRDSATQLTVNVSVAADAPTGTRTISVSNPDAGLATCADCFTVNAAPTATSVSPASRGRGATNENVVLTGTSFAGTPTVAFSGSGITVNSVTRDSATQLTANITVASDAATGARTLRVTNPDAGLATCPGCFTVNAAAAVSSVSPSALGQNAPATDLVVSGAGFAASPTVTIGGSGVTVNSVTRDSATQLTVNVSVAADAATGDRTLTVSNGDGGTAGTCATCFTVTARPVISSMTPSSRGQGASSQSVTLTGTGFGSTPALAFSGSGVTVDSVTRDSATQLTAVLSIASDAAAGARSITVTNPDLGSSLCDACFTVTGAPSIASIAPGTRGQGAEDQDIVITGAGFVDGALVGIAGSGVTVNSVTWDSATQLTANVSVASDAAEGARSLTVTNADAGAATCVDCFTVTAAPTIASLTPSSRGQGAAAHDIVMSGAAFAGTPTVAISGSGVTVHSVTRDSATQLTVNVSVAPDAAEGARSIQVVNPDAGTSICVDCFAVNLAPGLSSVSPASRGRGAQDQQLVLAGANFSGTPSVAFSGTRVTVEDIVRDSATQLTVTVSVADDADLGARDITVVNPDGGPVVCAGCFTVVDAGSVSLSVPSALTGNVLALFPQDVSNVSTTNLVLRVSGTTANIAGTIACADAASAPVSCSGGGIRTATLRPSSPLIAGQRYTASVNPSVTASAIVDGNGAPVPATDSAFRASTVEQQTSTGTAYAWRKVSTSSAHGGSYTMERLAGARARYTFTGTSVIWYTVTGPSHGQAIVKIDGVTKPVVNNYSSSTRYKVARSYSGLAAGTHTIEIMARGLKGSSAGTGTYVAVDAFRAGGVTVTTPSPAYHWRSVTASPASGGSYVTADLGGSTLDFRFAGTGIDWVTVLGRDQGRSKVYVDGVLKATVDNYRSSTLYGAKRSIRGLSDGVHTLRIVVLGTRHASGTGTKIAIDRFDVI